MLLFLMLKRVGWTELSFHLPSAYGLAIWLAVSLLLMLAPKEWGGVNGVAIATSSFVAFSYLTSNIIFSKVKLINKIALCRRENHLGLGVVFLVIGVFGAVSNIIELFGVISSAGIDFVLITGEVLRREAANVESIGQQISYFGWFGACVVLSCLEFARSGLKKFICIALIVFLVLIEFSQMNRMRVIWLIVMLSYSVIRVRGFSVIYFAFLSSTVFFVFIISGVMTNKINSINVMDLFYSSFLQVAAYLIGGVLYFVDELGGIEDSGFSFENTLRPAYKVLYALGLRPHPPASGILDFKAVAGELVTNVGSFLLSFVNDFGSVGIVVAIVFYTLFVDLIFVYLHKKKKVVVVPLMASLIFIALMSPFASQHESMAFIFIFVLSLGVYVIHGMIAFVRSIFIKSIEFSQGRL